jgi:hypothetical protein
MGFRPEVCLPCQCCTNIASSRVPCRSKIFSPSTSGMSAKAKSFALALKYYKRLEHWLSKNQSGLKKMRLKRRLLLRLPRETCVTRTSGYFVTQISSNYRLYWPSWTTAKPRCFVTNAIATIAKFRLFALQAKELLPQRLPMQKC